MGIVIGIILRNYQDAIWFVKTLDVDFDYYVLRNPNYDPNTRKAIAKMYANKKPRIRELIIPSKNLHRRNYFTDNEIELFFTRYIQ